MYIQDGIAYAAEPEPLLKVDQVQAQDNYLLWLHFNNGETRLYDFSQKLSGQAFAPLRDPALFRQVALDHGVTVWPGDIDIAPETLFAHSMPVPDVE